MDNKDEIIAQLRDTISKQRVRLENDYKSIRALAGGYSELHLFNLDTQEYIPYFVESEDSGSLHPLMAEYPDFYSAHRAYVERYCHPDYKDRLLQYSDKDFIRESLQGKKRRMERVLIMKNGEYNWFEFVLINFGTSVNEVSQVAAGYIDVHDTVVKEKQRTIALENARQAKEAEEERYNFLVNVAHELRTPLTLIIGPLRRVIRNGEVPQATIDVLGRVCGQADRMTSLLNTVLTTNKIEQGAEAAHPVPVNFNEWVTASSDEFRDEALNHNIEIAVVTDPSIGSVNMDEHLCKIVFSNLMMNAMRYTFHDTRVEVSTSWNEAKDAVRVSVRDYGAGIGDIDVSKLFERYYRATEEKTGFGIGLSYSKTIVDAHGGKIGAFNNQDGTGATFWFELPADYGDRVQLEPQKEEDVPETGKRQISGLKDVTLLYVEDDYDLRDFVQIEMEDYCGKVLVASNGKKALDVLAKEDVDIILTDVMMPEIDGLELCQIVKGTPEYRHIPVIMLSARADVESIQRGIDAQANFYLDKPFDMDQLIEVLEQTISTEKQKNN